MIPSSFLRFVVLAVPFALALGASARADAPVSVLGPDNAAVTLAAASPGSGDGLKSDPGTIGEFYATNPRAYNPVVTAALPAGWDGAQVWVRQRGGPFQLKGNGGGTELNWIWETPATWTWVSYGTYTRAQLTEKFLFIRSDQLAPDAGIDVVVLLRDEGRPTPAELDLLAKQAAAEQAKK